MQIWLQWVPKPGIMKLTLWMQTWTRIQRLNTVNAESETQDQDTWIVTKCKAKEKPPNLCLKARNHENCHMYLHYLNKIEMIYKCLYIINSQQKIHFQFTYWVIYNTGKNWTLPFFCCNTVMLASPEAWMETFKLTPLR